MTGTMLEEAKPLFTEKFEFELRDDSFSKQFLSDFSHYQFSDKTTKIYDSSILFSSTSRKFLVQFLLEVTKPEVTEKFELEDPDESNFMSPFWFCHWQDFDNRIIFF